MNVREKPLKRGEKPRVGKRECPLLLQALYYVKNEIFSLYNDGVLPKKDSFLYLTSLQAFYSFL